MGDAGPLGPLFKLTLGPGFRGVYRAGLARKNARFDKGHGVTRFDRPVISVGNLSVGGTGKTPMVETIVRILREKGHHPCIAMRGYKPLRGLSDEAETYRAALDGIQIVAQPDRSAGLHKLLATPAGEAIDSIVLDDGFQHRQIARDLDIVLVDATRSPFDDDLLPMGSLRESPQALERAHAVIVTRADLVSSSDLKHLTNHILSSHAQPPMAVANHVWQSIHSNRETAPKPVESLAGLRVLLVCAIGNPQAMCDQAVKLGAVVVDKIFLQDHDAYGPKANSRIRGEAYKLDVEAVLVTEKDWMKLREVPADYWPVAILHPKLGIEFSAGSEAFEAAILAAAAAQADTSLR